MGAGGITPRARPRAYTLRLGVDGVFADSPETALAARQVAAIPEPGTYALLLTGLWAVAALARRLRG